MAAFTTGDGASIHYEVHGDGFPVLLIAPGGMRSAISFWENTPWNPIDDLEDRFTVVAMDQRNAGASTGPVRATDGWQTYAADQLALMDHLGLERFHVAGMCIGGPYALGLIQAAASRVASAVLFQTIGRENNREVFYQMFDNWADALKPKRPDVGEGDWASFRGNLYDGDKVFFNVDVDFVESCTTPLLVLCGNDVYHPASASLTIAELAPDATFIESWKEGAAREEARAAVRRFLIDNTP
ncbi:MAG: alpha/beta fold hydrolase [Pseudomonadales bacterium]